MVYRFYRDDWDIAFRRHLRFGSGMVRSIDMTYMQTVFGFFFGYILIAKVLLPLYYKLKLTSIYSYLGDRIGKRSYKTGASFFLLSKIVGAAARLYLVVLILQHYVFSTWNIPFWVTVIISIFLVWLYTYRSGIKTIIWTDTLRGTLPGCHAGRHHLEGKRCHGTGYGRHGANPDRESPFSYL